MACGFESHYPYHGECSYSTLKSCKNTRFLYCDLAWGVVDDYALSRVYGHIRDGQRENIGNEDCAHAVIVNREFLHPLTVDLLCLVDLNAVDQLIQHTGRQLLRPCVFADGGNEHICCHSLAAQLVHFSTERLDFLGQFLLFRFIPAGHFGKAIVGQLARNIVLRDRLSRVSLEKGNID